MASLQLARRARWIGSNAGAPLARLFSTGLGRDALVFETPGAPSEVLKRVTQVRIRGPSAAPAGTGPDLPTNPG